MIPTQLLTGDDRISANPKLNNCVKAGGQRDMLGHSPDSNVLMPTSYIKTMMSAWQSDSGLVCAPPLGSRPIGFWRMSNAPSSTVPRVAGNMRRKQSNCFAQGKSMLWNKPFLEDHGGIRALAAEIAEDAASTKLVRNAGLKVHLVSTVRTATWPPPRGRNLVPPGALGAAAPRDFPQYFAPEILTGALPPLLFARGSRRHDGDEPRRNRLCGSRADVCTGTRACRPQPLAYLVPHAPRHDCAGHGHAPRLGEKLIGTAVAWRGNVMTIGTAEKHACRAARRIIVMLGRLTPKS